MHRLLAVHDTSEARTHGFVTQRSVRQRNWLQRVLSDRRYIHIRPSNEAFPKEHLHATGP